MSSLPHWMYALAAFYGAAGFVIYRLARKPSCRVCLYRHCCEDRLCGGANHFLSTPHRVAPREAQRSTLTPVPLQNSCPKHLTFSPVTATQQDQPVLALTESNLR